ncbi:AAA family ATPase [Candidatus Woesearchaeota archaeon]|nr:AAA family ATPase [Candidatus Woesearchaeota archaeon]
MLKISLNKGENFYKRKKQGEELRKDIGMPAAFKTESELAEEKERRAKIEFSRVRERIKNIDEEFEFNANFGEIVLVTGRNGSGKTSMIEAIAYTLGWSSKLADNYWAEDTLSCMLNYGNEEVNLCQNPKAVNLFYFDFVKFNPRSLYGSTSLFYKLHKGGSNRQTLDEAFIERLREFEDGTIPKKTHLPRIILLDEPELNMDPERESTIAEEIRTYFKNRDIVIVSTNSNVLVSSKLPRINLNKYPIRKK